MNIGNTIRTGLFYAGLGATALVGCSQPNVYNMNPADLFKLIESNYKTAAQDETITFNEARQLARDIRFAEDHQAYHGDSPALDELIAKNKDKIDAFLKESDKTFRLQFVYVSENKELTGVAHPLAPEGKTYEKGTPVPEDLLVADDLTEVVEGKKVFKSDARLGVGGQVTYDQLASAAEKMGTTVYKLMAGAQEQFTPFGGRITSAQLAERAVPVTDISHVTEHYGNIRSYGGTQNISTPDQVYAMVLVGSRSVAQTQPQTAPATNTAANNAPADNTPSGNAPADNTPAANNAPANNAPANNAPAENTPRLDDG